MLKHWQENRLASKKSTDFGALDFLQEAEIKNREAHDNLMYELRQLSVQLEGSDRRQSNRRREDHR
jgi:hypothetical protein